MRVTLQKSTDLDELEHGALSYSTVYEVLGIESDWYRLLNDDGLPYLYDPARLKVVDANEPAFWVSSFEVEGERYAYPVEWNQIGFFEDFHDRVPEARKSFRGCLEQVYPVTYQTFLRSTTHE